MTRKQLQQQIRVALEREIAALMISRESAISQRAHQRLRAVAEHFPAFLLLLVEPWGVEPVSEDIQNTLIHCACVHLYARILDDALDENLPVYRLNLLRFQAIFWRSATALGARFPNLHEASANLIAETTLAVTHDDVRAVPLQWGAKNHHLLLAPMLLSGNGPNFLKARAGLSALIALSQAGDEWVQGVFNYPHVVDELLSGFPIWLSDETIAPLRQYGWNDAAERVLHDGTALLDILKSKLNPIP